MLSLLKFLTKESFPIYNENDSERRLLFEFDGFSVRIVFNEIENYDAFETCFDEKQLYFDCNQFLSLHKILCVFLTNTCIYSESEEYDEESSYNWSFFLEMFDIVNQLNMQNSKYVQSYVVEDRIYDDCGWDMGCPVSVEYGWFISIHENYWNEPSFSSIVDCINKLHNNKRYCSKIKSNKESDSDIRIISTNTKARRLGYLKLFLSSFRNRKQHTIQSFNCWLSEKLEMAEFELNEYKNNKGIITKTGNNLTSKPYLDVAIDLGLLVKKGNVLELGKLGKVYLELSRQYSSLEDGWFELNIVDKSILLESILLNDFLYMSILLEYSYTRSNPSYKDLKSKFQELVIRRIKNIRTSYGQASFNLLIKLNNLEKRISSWSKAEVYLEHILMPRLNWLFDLDIIDLHKDLSFSITESGKRLFSQIAFCYDTNQSFICTPIHFFQMHYMRIFCDIYKINARIDTDETKRYYDQFFSECNMNFKTLAPNRVTYSSFVTYCKRKFMMEHLLIVDESSINTFLKSDPQKYIFKYQQYYKDGYIQKK